MNEKFLQAHGRSVRHQGKFYRIIAHRLGNAVLAQAEEIGGKNIINLVRGRSPLVLALRQLINLGLVS